MTSPRMTLVLGFMLAVGCDVRATEDQAEPIYWVPAGDEEMAAAVEQAIATLPEFYAHFARPPADSAEFMTKFDIVPGEDGEFVWAEELGW